MKNIKSLFSVLTLVVLLLPSITYSQPDLTTITGIPGGGIDVSGSESNNPFDVTFQEGSFENVTFPPLPGGLDLSCSENTVVTFPEGTIVTFPVAPPIAIPTDQPVTVTFPSGSRPPINVSDPNGLAIVSVPGGVPVISLPPGTNVSFPQNSGVIISFPSGGQTQRFTPVTGFTVSTNSPNGYPFHLSAGFLLHVRCDSLVVTIPQGKQITGVFRGALVSIKNNLTQFPLPVSMDPLPYDLNFPSKSTMIINRKNKLISVTGTNCTINAKKVNPKDPKGGQK